MFVMKGMMRKCFDQDLEDIKKAAEIVPAASVPAASVPAAT